MLISERIFLLMDKNGLSQKEFSEQTGISQSTISDWKRKKTNPSADKILKICLSVIKNIEKRKGAHGSVFMRMKDHGMVQSIGKIRISHLIGWKVSFVK